MPDDDAWSDARLTSTAADFPGVGTDADLDDIDRFRAGVSRLVARTLDLSGIPDDPGLSVFVLRPDGPPAASQVTIAREPMLDRGRVALDHRVWFVSHVVSVGHWVPARFDDDDDLFQFVCNDLSCGQAPAVVFDPRDPGPELRFYPDGLGTPEGFEALRIARRPIALEDIFERINRVYENQLVTPGAQAAGGRLWANAKKGLVRSDAEAILSALLQAALNGAFLHCRTRVEQTQPTGRVDLELEERDPTRKGAVMRHAILELKVLRGRNPNGTAVGPARTRKHVEDGVLQAAAYRDDKSALAAALCCFDMRREFTGDKCFGHVASRAAELEVELRVWHLFWTAPEYRRHILLTGTTSS